MFIQIEATSDPGRLRFLPGQAVFPGGRLDIADRNRRHLSPLATRLFDIAGIAGVTLEGDAIVVRAEPDAWTHLKPAILGVVMEHFLSGAPHVTLPPEGADSGALAADRIRTALRQVIDPELGFNIVDLGLIYDIEIIDSLAAITMTTTTRGCPATDYLQNGAAEAARGVAGIEAVDVRLSYDPPWNPEMMSDAAKAELTRRRNPW